MKRYIKSAKASENFTLAVSDIEGLAYKTGYKLETKPNNEIELTFNSNNKDIMPELIVKTEHDSEKSEYTYDVTMKFPDIDTAEYDDTLDYLMNRWSSVARLVNEINSFTYKDK